ncbi:MAG: nitroreductase family protein [Firmicutes bacterium]|nr:nitroreductase family protein [Bacillota bacterium]
MNVYEAIENRRSVRKYEQKDIPMEVLTRILNAARLAPSANNRQDWKFIVVKDPELKKKVAEAARGQSFVGEASVIIAGVALNPEKLMSCEVPAYAVDLAIAMTQITLAAVEEGLGTCWIGAFDQAKVKELLGIPAEYKVVELMPLGYPADKPRTKIRKRLEEVVAYDRFA